MKFPFAPTDASAPARSAATVLHPALLIVRLHSRSCDSVYWLRSRLLVWFPCRLQVLPGARWPESQEASTDRWPPRNRYLAHLLALLPRLPRYCAGAVDSLP